ncbi:hypothetical protein ACRE1U_05265 [Helicobacter himalayensis]|uniref:hypothetical protein n=1 Tax=Helicobacter himalayensis TaxID=1591088 RepID=UPI003D6E34A4
MQLSRTQIKNFFLLFLMLFIPLFILNILFPSQSDDLGAFGGGIKDSLILILLGMDVLVRIFTRDFLRSLIKA